jgi:hypothetical protein
MNISNQNFKKIKMEKVIIFLGFIALATAFGSMSTPSSSFKVSTSTAGCTNFESASSALKAIGLTKFVCPFGFLFAGTSQFPDNHLIYSANLFAELIDRNGDGKADSELVLSKLIGSKIAAFGGHD